MLPSTLAGFLWFYAKRYRFFLSGFIFVGMFWAFSLSLSSYALKLIIDGAAHAEGSLISSVGLPASLYVGLGLLTALAFRLHDWCQMKTFPGMKIGIIEDMFSYVENHSYSYFQKNFAGSLANKINDMARGSVAVIRSMDEILAITCSLMIGSITMFFVHPYFALVLVIWSLLFLSAALFLSKKAQKYSEIFSEARSTAVGRMVDSMGNILNVKLFSREGYEKRHLHTCLEEGAVKERNSMGYLLKVKTFYSLVIFCLTVTMMCLLIYERSKGRVTVGDFALILTLSFSLIGEVFHLTKLLVPFSEEIGTCRQALSVLSLGHEITDSPKAVALSVPKGEIVFDRVHFHYREGRSVFADKSIVIRPGERVGLVGFSGSGKSTFVNLILRFFDVDSGSILIDGQDVREVTQESLRGQIAMIPQDPTLFHRSLLENIRYGRLDASDEEVIAASKKAHCHEFIERLPEKYQSLVGDRGVKLSGGQRQRIAIARAFLKNAPILILDEATSSLDSITERYIQESLSLLMKERTTLVIAHRLSTLFHMDRILVFNEGKIVQEGTHQELMSLDGHYAKLWRMQSGEFI